MSAPKIGNDSGSFSFNSTANNGGNGNKGKNDKKHGATRALTANNAHGASVGVSVNGFFSGVRMAVGSGDSATRLRHIILRYVGHTLSVTADASQ